MRDKSFVFHTVKITVVKAAMYIDLAERYNQVRPGIQEEGISLTKCPFFEIGQEFTVVTDPFGNCKPEGFCDWAWADIWKDVVLVADRAGFVEEAEIADLKPHFTCCTDGLRPVTFMIEAIE